jgi:hypothetical protein
LIRQRGWAVCRTLSLCAVAECIAMLELKPRVVRLVDALPWRPLSDGVVWVLTRNKDFTDRASFELKKCFVGDLLVHPDTGGVLDLYYDNAQTAWKHLGREIAAGKIKTIPPAWRPRADDGWQENSSIQVDFAAVQSVFPEDGPRYLTDGPPVCPANVRDLSLTELVYWIVTKGGSIECNITDIEVWKPGYDAVTKKIVDREIDLLGRRRGTGPMTKISGDVLVDIGVDYPYQCYSRYVLSDENYLLCYGIGLGDELFFGRELAWSDLRVKGAQVASQTWFLQEKAKRGRRPIYDMPALIEDLKKHLSENGPFTSKLRLKDWLLESGHIKLRPGKKPPRGKCEGDAPDAHTVEDMINRHLLGAIPNLIASD